MIQVLSLPLRTRLCAGEDVESFARRLAARNHTTVRGIESALKSDLGVATFGRARGPLRLQVWRDLGDLSPAAFGEPESIAGYVVRVRRLCELCTHGNTAFGRRPRVGSICLRHGRWLGDRQWMLPAGAPALRAESRYRRHVATRGVLFDAPIMQIALRAAGAAIPADEIDHRIAQQGFQSVHAAVYPEQVAIARLLTRSEVVGPATDPQLTVDARRNAMKTAIAEALSHQPDALVWAAVREVDAALARTTELRRPYRAGREIGDEIEHGILRFTGWQA